MKKLFTILAVAGISATAVLLATGVGSAKAADDTTADAPWQGFVDRVAEIVGVSSEDLGGAMEQAREELGPMHGMGGGYHMMGMFLMEDVATCADVTHDQIHELISSSEGMTLEEALVELGVSDVDGVKSCSLESMIENIDELEASGDITAERADDLRENAEERLEDLFTKVRGEVPMMEGGMKGRGFGRGMHFAE